MARNRIQFQKGLSEAQFVHLYGDEAKCRALVTAWRWPDGFRCPRCKGSAHCLVSERRLFQCNSCHHQASPTAGTIFDSTKLPLTVWFRAMYLITQTKQGISSIELGRRLGTTQTTAWKIKTKLAEVMRISGEAERLEGRVEMDDAYLGGQKSGGKTGRGSPGKRPFVVAVQTDAEGPTPKDQAQAHRSVQAQAGEKRCQADHCGGRDRRHRRAQVLSWNCRCRLHARGDRNRLRTCRCSPSSIQVGEHDARQYQDCDRCDLPGRAQEAHGAHTG